AIGAQRLVAQARYWTGQTLLAAGDMDAAELSFRAMVGATGSPPGVPHAYAWHGLGDVAARRGDYATAERKLDNALELAQLGSDAILEGRVRLSRAAALGSQGRIAAQVAELHTAAAVFSGCGSVYLEARAMASIGAAEASRGDRAAADAAWNRVAELYDKAAVPDADRLTRRDQ
ncbi:MAG TPA: hypothetical protein VGJ28_07330, partial [Micromonosporaceae bacterium]